jgi:hypothetical protein
MAVRAPIQCMRAATEIPARQSIARAVHALRCTLAESNNAGVVAVTNKGRSHSTETNAILKHVYWLQAECGMCLQALYVPTHSNIADALSRGDIAAFQAGFPTATDLVSIPLPPHLADKLVPFS